MSLPHRDSNYSTGWGAPWTFPVCNLTACLLEVYLPQPIWRQSPFSIPPEGLFSRDIQDEVVVALDRLLGEKTEAMVERAHSILRRGGRMGSAGRVETGTVFGSLATDPALKQTLLDYLAPVVESQLLGQARNSLTIAMEWIPFNLHPAGQRGERFLGRRELIKRLETQAGLREGKAIEEDCGIPVPPVPVVPWDPKRRRTPEPTWEATTGRLIWDPTPLLLVLPDDTVEHLRPEGMPLLRLTEVTLAAHGQQLLLSPKPWGQLKLWNPWLDLTAQLPLLPLHGPPTLERIQGGLDEAPADSPMRRDLEQFRKVVACSTSTPPRYWTWADAWGPTVAA